MLFMIEKVKNDPVSPKMLKISGEDVMRALGIAPGPRVGSLLAILLEDVLDDPLRNTEEYLITKLEALGKLDEKALRALAESAKDKKQEVEAGMELEMKKKYHVQ
jgi:hypothetical protein